MRFQETMLAWIAVAGFASGQDLATAARGVKQTIAHRGSSADRPENTLAAIRRAMEAGATAIEVDVRRSKDGHLVLMHDAKLDRTTNGVGLVADLTLAELQKLDAGAKFQPKFKGEPIPTLEQALKLCKGQRDLVLDLQEAGLDFARQVADEVKKHGDEKRILLGVRQYDHIKTFRELLPSARLLGLIPKTDDIESFAQAGVPVLRLWTRWIEKDANLVDRVKKIGAGLHLNGTNGTIEDISPLLKYGPVSIASDDPGTLVETLKRVAAMR